jgi:hypothetical protein
VALTEDGELEQVVECRVVWSPGRDPANNFMTERVRRAVEQARDR